MVQYLGLGLSTRGEQDVQLKLGADDTRQAQQLLCSQPEAAHPLTHNGAHTVREFDLARRVELPPICNPVYGTLFDQGLEQFLGEERIALRALMHQGHTLIGDRYGRQTLPDQRGCPFDAKTAQVHLVDESFADQLPQHIFKWLLAADRDITERTQ